MAHKLYVLRKWSLGAYGWETLSYITKGEIYPRSKGKYARLHYPNAWQKCTELEEPSRARVERHGQVLIEAGTHKTRRHHHHSSGAQFLRGSPWQLRQEAAENEELFLEVGDWFMFLAVTSLFIGGSSLSLACIFFLFFFFFKLWDRFGGRLMCKFLLDTWGKGHGQGQITMVELGRAIDFFLSASSSAVICHF